MSLNIRPFNYNDDMSDVCDWWDSQGWDKNTLNVISDTGFVIEDNKHKYAASWLIKTNSPIYLIEWTVGNPNTEWKYRAVALNVLNEYLCDLAKKDGASAVMIMTKNKRYIDKLLNSNFVESDQEMIHLVRGL